MNLSNPTHFQHIIFPQVDQFGQPFWVVVLKGTFDIQPDGTLTEAETQEPLNFEEKFYGAVNESSMVAESDIAPYKPKTDIIVLATALAPGGKPAVSWEVEVEVCSATVAPRLPPRPAPLNPFMEVDQKAIRRWEDEVRFQQLQADYRRGETIAKKRLRIVGQRHWKRRWWPRRLFNAALAICTLGLLRLSNWRLTFPKPLLELPIRYEYAWGGNARLALGDGKELFLAAPQNTVGMGYFPTPAEIRREYGVGYFKARRWWKRLLRQFGNKVPAPMIECPKQPVWLFAKPHPAEGFGIVTKAWEQRSSFAGTYDEKWQEEKAPLLPDNFNPAYWNGAHADLQVLHLSGDERIYLRNVKPEGPLANLSQAEFKLCLPKQAFQLFLNSETGNRYRQLLNLDTVAINMHKAQVTLLWRAAIIGETMFTGGSIEERTME